MNMGVAKKNVQLKGTSLETDSRDMGMAEKETKCSRNPYYKQAQGMWQWLRRDL
jgi:hypothetical protein